MHRLFEEIGEHLKLAHYKGANTVYRKSVGMVEIIVEFEKTDDNGFRIAVGSHSQLEPGQHHGKGHKFHLHDCPNVKFISDAGGKETWQYHQSIEERSGMINRILREISRIEHAAT